MSSWGAAGGFGATQGSNLFGNSATSNAGQPGGLFGSATTGATSANPATGLFGNSSTKQTTQLLLFGGGGGLFNTPGTSGIGTGTGTSAAATSGSFGVNTSKPGLFSNTGLGGGNVGGGVNNTNANLTSTTNANPYQQSLVNVQNEQPLTSMPPSITGQLFHKETPNENRGYSYLQVSKQQESKKSGLLSRLAQAFKHIRNPGTTTIRGLFTQNNISVLQKKELPSNSSGVSRFVPSKVTKQQTKSKLTSLEGKDLSNIKRLIIKSEPLKYHQIDANEVFSKRRANISIKPVTTNGDATDDDDELDEAADTAYPSGSKVLYTVSKDRVEDESKIRVILKQSQPDQKQIPNSDKPELNNGYWTLPSISQLIELTEEELLNIKNFIIGRKGFGQVAYDHPVDLSGFMEIAREEGIPLEKVLFERIFVFDKKVVLVYPDEDNDDKPAVGNGVNIPATITIENVTPKDHQPLSEFVDKLKNMVGTEFVTYDPLAKRWIFKVLHFSVWGLIDEDELNPQMYEKLISIKRKQDNTEDQSFIQYQNAYQAEIIEQELKKQRLNRDTHGLPGAWGYNATQDTPLNVQRNEEIFEEIRNEIETYRENQVTQDLSKVDFEDKDKDKVVPEYSSSSSTAEVEEEEEELSSSDPALKVAYFRDFFNNLPPGTDLNEIVQERVYEPDITNDEAFDIIQRKPDIPTADDWLLQLELTNNIDSPLNPQLLDVLATKPSQAFNLANVDDILFGDFNKAAVLYSTPIPEGGPGKVMDAIELTPIQLTMEPKLVDVFLSKITIKAQDNKYPQIASYKELNFADFQQCLECKLNETALLLKLASVLFDVKIGSEFEIIKYQREAFVSWLAEYNKPLLAQAIKDHSKDKLQIVLDYLYYGDLKLAVEAAWETSNAYLSPVLVLLDSNDQAAIAIAQNQLESWRNNNELENIPAPVVKVYQILAREIQLLSKELPWNMVFSLKLLYDDPTKTLNELIQVTLKEQTYLDSAVIALLQLYNIWCSKNLEEALLFVKECSQLSISLKWVIQEVLLAGKTDDIGVEFGNYLLDHGLWFQSLVAFLCLNDGELSTKNVRKVVLLNIQRIDEQTQIELTEKLHIPKELIAEARALEYEKSRDYWVSTEAFMNAKLWSEAHRIIASKLGPEVVISNNETSRRALIDLMNKFPSNGSIIPTWNVGAGIYESYCELIANNEDLESLTSLLKNIPYVATDEEGKEFNEKVALKLVSKFVGDIAIAHSNDLEQLKNLLNKLYLGEPEKQYFNHRITV
ncbi:uncharacterized protein KQ657_001399 [Scheffersomyces spartinae]|uniref:Peptidase S59 domain-containing protein n=1 Tax=Scheffersomyces spartinae TaxID=45513 RepID=A0A9P8AHW6_9ASCO|nr:uncharacterized protein KQ657_001399 [Scheffersomyces spartinae]KAG7192942.1 hypothetical protein KQ657_001399 [Scheffersomyces spartinae]